MYNYIKIILRGFGQVMLQNNAVTGLFFLLGIFYNSWYMAGGALLGCVAGTLFAQLLKYNSQDISNGLYGFNGALVGVGLFYYFSFSWWLLLAVLAGGAVSAFLVKVGKEFIPVYTAPFIIFTWAAVVGLDQLNFIYNTTTAEPWVFGVKFLSLTSMGFGQVMFQASIITGLLFFVGILFNSRLAAVYALYGSVLGGLLALAMNNSVDAVNIGLFGYNAVLCGIALGNKKWGGFILATLAIFLTLVMCTFNIFGAITLTTPFVAATWLVLIIKKCLKL